MMKQPVGLRTIVCVRGLLLLLSAGWAGHVVVTRNQVLPVPAPRAPAAVKASIMASTLQLAMYEYAEDPAGWEPGSRGLGTLVANGEQTLIITHDHWAHLTPTLHEVELRDSAGHLLVTLDAAAFRRLIAHRDGGTMVLRAPAGLHGPVPTTVGTVAGTDGVVWFARRASASGRLLVEVVAATITSVEKETVPASMRLRNLDGSAVTPGDSGGGVWANGRLVGNLWAGGVKEERTFWCGCFRTDTPEPSDLVITALQPLGAEAMAVAPLQPERPPR